MAADAGPKPVLSAKVMGLRFMQRAAEKKNMEVAQAQATERAQQLEEEVRWPEGLFVILCFVALAARMASTPPAPCACSAVTMPCRSRKMSICQIRQASQQEGQTATRRRRAVPSSMTGNQSRR